MSKWEATYALTPHDIMVGCGISVAIILAIFALTYFAFRNTGTSK